MEKAFPSYRDRHSWTRHPTAVEESVKHLPRGTALDVTRLESDSKRVLGLSRRVPNGYFDPRCAAIVCHELAHVWMYAYIRSPQLTAYLNAAYSQYEWDSITVGRLIGAVVNETHDVYDGRGELLEVGFDSRGRYWMLVEPSLEGRLWLLKLRQLFLDASERVRKYELDKAVYPLDIDQKTLVSVFGYLDNADLRPVTSA